MSQRVAITGASGLIGGALSASLSARGRRGPAPRPPRAAHRRGDPVGPGPARARPRRPGRRRRGGPPGRRRRRRPPVDPGVQAADPRLAGRRHPHGRLGAGRARRPRPVAVLVSASAIGFYGDRGDEVLTEASSAGPGLPRATWCARGRAPAKPAEDAGLRVVHARTGLVLSPDGRRHGAGCCRWPGWVWPARWARAGSTGAGSPCRTRSAPCTWHRPAHPLGPVNLTGPQPLPQIEVTRAVASALGRPALLPAPSLALKLVLGEFSSDILGSLRVVPSVLTASGFTFEHDTVERAADWLVEQADHQVSSSPVPSSPVPPDHDRAPSPVDPPACARPAQLDGDRARRPSQPAPRATRHGPPPCAPRCPPGPAASPRRRASATPSPRAPRSADRRRWRRRRRPVAAAARAGPVRVSRRRRHRRGAWRPRPGRPGPGRPRAAAAPPVVRTAARPGPPSGRRAPRWRPGRHGRDGTVRAACPSLGATSRRRGGPRSRCRRPAPPPAGR